MKLPSGRCSVPSSPSDSNLRCLIWGSDKPLHSLAKIQYTVRNTTRYGGVAVHYATSWLKENNDQPMKNNKAVVPGLTKANHLKGWGAKPLA